MCKNGGASYCEKIARHIADEVGSKTRPQKDQLSPAADANEALD
jgi:hypothetical protein